jgi:hypothetical protein
MRSPLSYLLLTKLKNQIKNFFKSPGKIIYLVIVLALIGVTVIGGTSADRKPDRDIRDLRELTAIITVFYSLMFVLMANKGFSSGASMFSMADVNMIFTGPFRQQKVLFYGLFQQLGTSLLLGLFIVFQYTWLHNSYDITYGQLLIILLGYALTVFFAQIAAMVIYAFTSADDRRKNSVRAAFYTMIGAFLVYIALTCLRDQAHILQRAVETVNGPAVRLFPVSGWIGQVVSGVLTGNPGEIILGLALCLAFLVVLVLFITYGKQDYYEDVLKSSEITQSAITARKEGRVGDVSPKNVKVGKTGITKGFGANAIYYKHRLENRRSRMLILDPMSLTFALITIVMAFFMKKAGISAVFITATTMQFFTVALGRFNKELLKPYIYLIPEPPLKKMLYGLAEALPSAVTDAVVVFIPIAFILGMSPAETVFCILARITYAFLFTAVNVAVNRLWGAMASKTLASLLYFVLLAVMVAPGIVAAILLATVYPVFGENVTVFLWLIIVNIPISVLTLFLCRNMLQYAELNQR